MAIGLRVFFQGFELVCIVCILSESSAKASFYGRVIISMILIISIPRREYTDGMGSESPDGWGSSIVFSHILIYKHLSLIKRPTRQAYET